MKIQNTIASLLTRYQHPFLIESTVVTPYIFAFEQELRPKVTGKVLPAWQGIKVLKTVWRPLPPMRCLPSAHTRSLGYALHNRAECATSLRIPHLVTIAHRLVYQTEWSGVDHWLPGWNPLRFRDCDAARLKIAPRRCNLNGRTKADARATPLRIGF